MGYDGWMEFNGIELFNVSRTTQLAEALGIDTVWTLAESVDWIQQARAGLDWDVVTTAPWYDPGYPASAEFAGIFPLAMPGLDDSTRESSPTEYIGDDGNPGRARSGTLSIVANAAIVALTDRGAEYGKRWLDKVLRGGDDKTFCVGSELRYFRHAPLNLTYTDPLPEAHRRDVKTTRGAQVTRKRSAASSATWFVTFTLTAGDSHEYGDDIPVLSNLGATTPVSAGGMKVRTNEIRNSGFADGLTSWTANPNVTIGATAIDGGPAAGVTNKTPSFYPIVSNLITVTPGEVLSYSLVQQINKAGSSVTHYMSFTDALGNQITTTDDTETTTLGKTTVKREGIVVPSNPGISRARVHALVAPIDNTTSVWVTDFIAERAVTVGSYFDGDKPYEQVSGKYHSYRWDGDRAVSSSSEYVSPTPTDLLGSGTLNLTQQGCPEYDYTPLYDPLYPALVPPPSIPDFLPDGWNIKIGDAFTRSWARIPAVEPSTLDFVPVLRIRAGTEARMVRISIWPDDSPTDDQCDPLWSVVVSYIPPNIDFWIDGEQKASYINSTVLRRTDSLVYGPDAEPVEWVGFNDPEGVLVTLDRFTGLANNDVRVDLMFVSKSD